MNPVHFPECNTRYGPPEEDKAFRKAIKAAAKPEPVDVSQLVVDLANSEKAIDSAYTVKADSLRKLEQVLKDRGVEVLVVPAAPDNSEVFVVYTKTNYYAVGTHTDIIHFVKVKVEKVGS